MDLRDNIFTTLHHIFDISRKYHGIEYLQELMKNISIGLNVDWALIGLFDEKYPSMINSLVIVNQGELFEDVSYPIAGSPCETVVNQQGICTYLDHVAEHFPQDDLLVRMKIRSYTGNILKDDSGKAIGVFAIHNTKPMRDKKNINAVMNFFTARINTEVLKYSQQNELVLLNEELQVKNNQLMDLQALSQTGIWEIDLAKREIKGDEKLYKLYQLPPDFSMTKDVLLHPFDESTKKRMYKYYFECTQLKRSFSDVLQFVDINKKIHWIRVVGHAVKNAKGKVIRITGAFQNITKEMQKHKDNILLKNELENFEDSINKFLIVAKTDQRGIITYANDKFCEISGFEHKELIGKNHRILNSGTHSFDFFLNLWRTISDGKPWEGVICNRAKDGTLYWVQTFIFPILDEKGFITEYTSIRFDITEKYKLSEELNEERERATFASQLAAVGEMSAGIAHEIANPLTVISGNLMMLRKKAGDANDCLDIISRVDRSVSRIGKIIRGLHHVAQKSRDNSFTLNSIANILQNTLEFSEEALKRSHIEFIMELPEHEILLNCNDVKISQIVLNLINNAKDAINEANSQEKWIKVAVEDHPDEILIKVIDSGPGIPDENKEKIMETFFTTKQVGKGTGLGLTLVNRFTKEHSGNVEVTTEKDNTCFVVHFPKNIMDMAI